MCPIYRTYPVRYYPQSREREEGCMDGREIRIIAVDFDGTLCGDCYPDIGMPNLTLIHLLLQLKREDKKLILWTCRCGQKLAAAVEWCRFFGLEFDAVNQNVPETLEKYGMESRKISADVYIDDKACFPWMTEREWRRYPAE